MIEAWQPPPKRPFIRTALFPLLGWGAFFVVVLLFWQPWKTRVSLDDVFQSQGQYWYVQESSWQAFDSQLAGYVELRPVKHPERVTPETFDIDVPFLLGLCNSVLQRLPASPPGAKAHDVFRLELNVIDGRTDEIAAGAPIEVRLATCMRGPEGLDGRYRYPNQIRNWPLTHLQQVETEDDGHQTILTFQRDRDADERLADFDFTYACRAVMAAPPPNLFEDVYTADISTVRIRAEIKRGFSLAYASAFLWQDFRVAGEQCLPLGPVEET